MVSEALITHMLSTWSGYGVYGVYGVFGPNLSLLQYVVGAMVSDGLDLGGRRYGVYGACSFGPGWSGL